LWIDTALLNTLREQYPVGTALYKATTQLRPEEASPSELLCPFCTGRKLVQQVIRGVEVDWCPACRGLFLDQGERERLTGSAATAPPGAMPPSLSPGGVARETPWSALAVADVLAGLAEILGDVWS